jgi:sigma-B regulation protein RsbU (phosphoserine phosphatase)
VEEILNTTKKLPILIVDDSTSYRRLLARHLNSWGNYTIFDAEDGIQALKIIKEKNIGIVISDWEMPNMNGPELCRAIRETTLHYVYFILVTSRGTSEDLILGMEAGADDFLTKPINQQELRVRLRAGERILQLEARLEEKNQSLNQAYQLIENDLKAAAEMQTSLLPEEELSVDHIQCKWFFQPSLFVSGDMLNFFRLDHEYIGFYSVDVSGHGVKSAMLSVILSRVLSHGSTNGLVKRKINDFPYYSITPPAEVVTELNAQYQMTINNSIYFTMVYGILNIWTGEGKLTRAGHPRPIIVHKDGRVVVIDEGDVPVGFISEPNYQEIPFHLEQGSRLYLYTDGITECENLHEEVFGEDKMISLLKDHHQYSLSHTLNDLQQQLLAWRKNIAKKGFDDDVSMLAIHFEG